MSLSKSEAPRRGPKSSRASPDAKTAIKSVRIETVDSPVFQIADRMREMVSKGELTPGMRLPSTRELSDQFNVNSSSVHRALKRLVKEGLLVRTPYVGTFVASPSSGSKIERLGFYIRNNHTFSRALLEQLTFLAHRKDFILEPFNDTRPEDQANASPPEDLLHEAKSRRIQGLITPSSSPERTKWIDSLPIPTATISTPLHPYGLNWNREALTSSSIERLIQRGCKRPGIITSLYERPFPNTDSYQTAVYRGYIKALKKAKLPLNERRIVGAAPIDKNFPDRSTPEFGYHSF
ncbi:MAG: GntR family transcriptional regulator, partial [Puniceicoccales bacterium]